MNKYIFNYDAIVFVILFFFSERIKGYHWKRYIQKYNYVEQVFCLYIYLK